jgi:phage recombination protein Bet
MSTDVFQRLSDELSGWLSPGDLRTLRQTDAQGGTMADFTSVVKKLAQRRLHPFSEHVYFRTQYDQYAGEDGRYVLMYGVTIDGLRHIADETGDYAGQRGPHFCGPEAEWREIWLEDRPPAAAKVAILRRDFDEPLWAYARWSDYAVTTSSGQPKAMWAEMGPHMLGKCAEALGLRKAFPQDLAGLYTKEEMQQADTEAQRTEEPTGQERSRSQATATEATASQPANQEPTGQAPTPPNGEPAATGAINEALGLNGSSGDGAPAGSEEATASDEPTSNGAQTITDAQKERLYAKARDPDEGGERTDAQIQAVVEDFGYDDPAAVTQGDYDAIVARLTDPQAPATENGSREAQRSGTDTEATDQERERSGPSQRFRQAVQMHAPDEVEGDTRTQLATRLEETAEHVSGATGPDEIEGRVHQHAKAAAEWPDWARRALADVLESYWSGATDLVMNGV